MSAHSYARGFERETVASLRKVLKFSGLPSTGTKAELIERMIDNRIDDVRYHLDQRTITSLQELLRSHELSTTGTKATLIQRIIDNEIYGRPFIGGTNLLRPEEDILLALPPPEFKIRKIIFSAKVKSLPKDHPAREWHTDTITFTLPTLILHHQRTEEEIDADDTNDSLLGSKLTSKEIATIGTPVGGMSTIYILIPGYTVNITGDDWVGYTLLKVDAIPGGELSWLNVLQAYVRFYNKILRNTPFFQEEGKTYYHMSSNYTYKNKLVINLTFVN